MGISFENGLDLAVKTVPSAWQHPETICCRITYGSQEYCTDNFRETNRWQSSDILVNKVITGKIEVFHFDTLAQVERGQSAEEKRSLIALIAKRLGEWDQHKQTEARLLQSLKMEAVGQLTGGIAHDFNNLLAVILGNAELAQSEGKVPNPRTDAIVRASGLGAELTQRLLAFSRRQSVYPQVINFGELAQGLNNMLSRTGGHH